MPEQKKLFQSKFVPGTKGSGQLFEENLSTGKKRSGPVECLGITFPNDEERRKHFLGTLREKLKDPDFRKIEGFPIGEDEDILALSDPLADEEQISAIVFWFWLGDLSVCSFPSLRLRLPQSRPPFVG